MTYFTRWAIALTVRQLDPFPLKLILSESFIIQRGKETKKLTVRKMVWVLVPSQPHVIELRGGTFGK